MNLLLTNLTSEIGNVKTFLGEDNLGARDRAINCCSLRLPREQEHKR
jgi:hypothetical protein